MLFITEYNWINIFYPYDTWTNKSTAKKRWLLLFERTAETNLDFNAKWMLIQIRKLKLALHGCPPTSMLFHLTKMSYEINFHVLAQ